MPVAKNKRRLEVTTTIEERERIKVIAAAENKTSSHYMHDVIMRAVEEAERKAAKPTA